MSRLMIVLLSALAVLAATTSAAAQSPNQPIETGSDLYAICSAGTLVSAGEVETTTVRAARTRCRNYLAGFVQASATVRTPSGMESPYAPRSGESLCYWLPDEMTWAEVEVLVINHAQANPGAMDMYAADFLVEVFVAEFPCEDPTGIE